MHISLLGVNYQTTPIAIRERAAISAEKLEYSLHLLRSYLPQGIILSTCNRTEVYTTNRDTRRAQEACLDFLKAYTDMPRANLRQHLYLSSDREAIEHLVRVASGLDSMVVGEFEVLGQVRHALEVAEKAGMVNLPLRHVFQSAIRAGRRVRQETGISKSAVSTSSVAVDLAASVVGDLRHSKIIVIGAGEAGRLVVKVARERGASHIAVASRTKERSSALAAALGGTAFSLANLVEELGTANIVVTCAGAPERILGVPHVEEAMKRRPELPLVLIDIAVPRDVEPAVKQISNVYLYNIDDLTEISSTNLKQRQGEIEKATQIMAAEVGKLVSWWQALEVRPVVGTLMSQAEKIRVAQLKRTLKRLRPLSEEELASLEAMTKSIVTKILRSPIQYLKANKDDDRDYAEMVSKLFQLDEEKGE